ncbi:MAG: thioredoxin domain-containing protein [Deltaproteobacteria bacterium]|nr:thioredoxin domain-containing protein [Deltaproteobacteria bacterium]
MQPRSIALVAARVFALMGLAVSCVLIVEYASPVPVLCGPEGGCSLVRLCWQQRVPWLSLPWVGLTAFAVALGFLLLPTEKQASKILPAVAGVSALSGLSLLVLQRVMCGAFCKFCIMTDGAAVLLGALVWFSRSAYKPATAAQRWLFGGGAVLLTAAALFLSPEAPAQGPLGTPSGPLPTVLAELPEPIAREQRPGIVTIVEFADYECPFCRREHDALTTAMQPFGARVRLVRKQLPLTGIHPHAEPAARGALCAEAQQRGDALSDTLFHTPEDELTTENIATIAQRLGLEMTSFRHCVSSEQTTSRLQDHRNDARDSAVNGLPTMFIGHERFDGYIDAPVVRASIERAFAGPPDAGTAPPDAR